MDENGDYCFGFKELSKRERVRFHAIVEQLLAEGPKEKKPEKKEKKVHTKEKKPQKKEKKTHTKTDVPRSDPKGSQKAKSKDAQPAKPATAQVPEAAPAAPEASPEADWEEQDSRTDSQWDQTVEDMFYEYYYY